MIITLEKFKIIAEQEKYNLIEIGITDVKFNNYTFELSNRLTSTLGQCRKTGTNDYTITLNSKFAEAEDLNIVRQTIMHELIHSCNDCMSHTGRWKQIADLVNSVYGYNISRMTVTKNYKQQKAKYKIVCTNCGCTSYIFRKNKIIKNLNMYRCIYCTEIPHKLELFLND